MYFQQIFLIILEVHKGPCCVFVGIGDRICYKGNHTGCAATVIHENGPKTVRNGVLIASCRRLKPKPVYSLHVLYYDPLS